MSQEFLAELKVQFGMTQLSPFEVHKDEKFMTKA